MGPARGKPAGSEYSQLLSEFEVVQRWEAESVTLLRGLGDGREYVLREFTFNDRREFEAQSQLLQSRKAQLEGCLHLLQLNRLLTQAEDQLCSTYFKIHALFEWEARSLDEEANTRNLQKRPFEERELWSVAASCILALSHLQRKLIPHRALTSRALLFNEAGLLRLYDPISTAAQPNLDTLLAKRSTPHLYLSPEECEQLEKECVEKTNYYKGDVWTLGMVLLEAGLTQYQDECYRDECSRIHWETLTYNLNRFAQLYSQELTLLLQLMLTKEEQLRPDWLDLEQRLAREEESRRQSARSSHASHHSVPDKQRIYQQIIYSEPVRTTPFLPPPTSAYQVPPLSSPQTPALRASAATCIAPSIIEGMRPLRSFFPSTAYVTNTKIDENLIFLPDEYSEVSDTPNREDSYFHSAAKQEGSVGELRNRQASAKVLSPLPPPSPQPAQPPQELEIVVEKYRQGSEYRGQKWRGMRHGRGVFLYLDGGRYEGEWCFNKMEGRGCLFYQSGKLAYEGEWLDDQFSGRGILYNEYPEPLSQPYRFQNLDQIEDYWVRYEGEFKSDSKRGHGMLLLSNGEVFEGEFVDDIAEGPGRYTTMDGQQVSGTWSNNRLLSD